MFCVIYLFDVKEGKEEQFLEAWKEMTKLIYQYEGSLGSRIHHEHKGKYIAYAQWPSEDRWENSGDQLPEEAQKWRSEMRQACSSIETIHKLNMIDDLLESNPF